MVAAETLMSILSEKQDSIKIQLNQQQKQTILENRRKITLIIETVILCGVPSRGHRDSGPLTFESQKNLEDNNNDGNLRALLRYRIKHNQVFKNDFLSAGPNSQYSSPRMQNEIISICNVLKMHGQGYDGATAMSGRLNGTQAYIREIIPTALYVHCAAHSLNLAVSNS